MKKNKIILISIGILIFILVILICELNAKKNEYQQQQEQESALANMTVPEGLENQYPTNTIAVSQKYDGNLKMKDISITVSKFMTQTVQFFRDRMIDLSDEEIIEYYNDNSFIVESKLGMLNSTEFLELMKYFSKLNSGNLNYESSTYVKETIKTDDSKLTVKLNIKYEKENEIEIKVSISNSSEKHPIKFTVYDE